MNHGQNGILVAAESDSFGSVLIQTIITLRRNTEIENMNKVSYSFTLYLKQNQCTLK